MNYKRAAGKKKKKKISKRGLKIVSPTSSLVCTQDQSYLNTDINSSVDTAATCVSRPFCVQTGRHKIARVNDFDKTPRSDCIFIWHVAIKTGLIELNEII